MFLKYSLILSSLAMTASGWEFGLDPAIVQGFTCSIEGASGKAACDASQDDDGSQCVFCELQRFGVCVSESQAQAMKQAIPGLECDDDDNTDDAAPADDDATEDDDNITPDDYWECLKEHTDKDSCISDDCEWCMSKAGYGICLSKEAADKVDKYDFFECSTEMNFLLEESKEIVQDPYDPTCLQASLEGDETTCKSTTDQDGNACEWCNVASANLCLTAEQAAIVEQFGGDCVTNRLDDPMDPSCLAASLSRDEATCESTLDADGNGCEWCSVNSVELCLNAEQAEIAEQIGGQCSHSLNANDPYDSSCLQASLDGDEASCEATTDEDGNPCEWCTVAGANLCLNSEQAQASELIGAQCSSSDVADPYDVSCFQASLQGDQSSCEAAVDEDGNSCEWCSVAGVNLCLTEEQAEAVALLGGQCDSMKNPFY